MKSVVDTNYSFTYNIIVDFINKGVYMNDALAHFDISLLGASFDQYYINSGGCAKASYEFYKFFLGKKGITIKGAQILTSDSITNNTSLTKYAKGVDSIIGFCNHVVLVIKVEKQTYIIDAIDGVLLKEDYLEHSIYGHCKLVTGYIKPRLLRKIAKTQEGWNTTFNTYHLKHLRTFLKEYKYDSFRT